jgi:hypothetical protein
VHLCYRSLLKPYNALFPLVYHFDPIMVENSLEVLCLEARTTVDVKWQVPLMIFRAFYSLVHEWNVEKLNS